MTEDEVDDTYQLLQGDLTTLFKLTFSHRSAVSESDVRLASVTLRKWLIEGLLGRLCHAGGWTPTLPALDNRSILEATLQEKSINYFLTGGIRFNGVPIQGIYNSSLPSTGQPLLRVGEMREREFKLGEFLRQRRIFFDGLFFSCEDIIKYTANKLGGAHYDLNRPDGMEKLEEAAAYMKFGGPQPQNHRPPSHLYLCLEPKGTEVLTALHIEIVAAAASLIQVRFDGSRIMQINVRKSWHSKLSDRFKKKKRGYKFLDY